MATKRLYFTTRGESRETESCIREAPVVTPVHSDRGGGGIETTHSLAHTKALKLVPSSPHNWGTSDPIRWINSDELWRCVLPGPQLLWPLPMMLNWAQEGGSLGCRLLCVPLSTESWQHGVFGELAAAFFIRARTRQSFSRNYICGQCYLSERTSPEWPSCVPGKRRQMPGNFVTRRRGVDCCSRQNAAEGSKGVSAFTLDYIWKSLVRLDGEKQLAF